MGDQSEKDLALLVRVHGGKIAAERVIGSVLNAVQACKLEITRSEVVHRLSSQLECPTAREHHWKATQYPLLAFLIGCLDSLQQANAVLGYCASYGCSSSPRMQALVDFLHEQEIDQDKMTLIAVGIVGYLPPNFAEMTAAEEN